MRKIALSILTLLLSLSMTSAVAWQPDPNSRDELQVAAAILDLKEMDPGFADWFSNSAGYAVFPRVGKGGFIIGGAFGRGLVITGDRVLGSTSLTQGSIGFQIGGQAYAQFIFFKDQTALGEFQRGNFELGAQATAVVATAGASADANYNEGVAVFTNISGGLMLEASVAGQRFTFEPR